MPALPAAGYISNDARNEGQYKTALDDLVASLRHIPWSGQVEVARTIVSGAITPPGSAGVVVVDTEAAAATDDLTNIVTTNYPDGSFLLLRNANAARIVVVKHAISGVGTVQLDRNADFALDDTKKWLLIRRHGSDWYELKRGPYRLQSETATKLAAFTVNKQDIGKIFICSGSYTVTLAAAAGCGNGHLFSVRNVGTGTLVVDPNGSELIDGGSVLAIPSGWSFQIMCTGSAWITTDSTGPQSQRNGFDNGCMDVWQRGPLVTYSGLSGITPCADRWSVGVAGAVRSFTVNRSGNVPAVSQAGVLLNYSLEMDITTLVATPAAADAVYFVQRMNLGMSRHFAQRQITVSFWVLSTKTGTYTLRVTKTGGFNYYLATYTVSAVDTWEFKTITIPASPLWDAKLYGFEFYWVLQCGSSNIGTTANTWYTPVSPANMAASGQANLFDSASNVFRLTGVKIELGAIATGLDVMSFADEYLQCCRYYQKSFQYGTTPATNVGSNTGEYVFPQHTNASVAWNAVWIKAPIPMNGTATPVLYNPNSANFQVRNRNTGTDCTGSLGGTGTRERGFTLTGTTPAGSNIGETLAVHWTLEVPTM